MASLDQLKASGCDPTSHLWSRRGVLGLVGWGAVLGSLGAGQVAFVRMMYPRVLYEPRTEVKIGWPSEYAVDTVSDRWLKLYRFWVLRTRKGFAALSARCTHLGCTPLYLAAENKFKCPCHGSGFTGLAPDDAKPGKSGLNFEGPAPRALERFKIGMAEDGQLLVDFGKTFAREKGEWDRPEAFADYAGLA